MQNLNKTKVMIKYFCALSAMVFISCTSSTPPPEAKKESVTKLNTGTWRVEIQLSDTVALPFLMVYEDGETPTFTIQNADERIVLDKIKIVGDSIFMEMPVFQSGFEGIFTDSEITGDFVKYDAEDYRLPFVAKFNNNAVRFTQKDDACCDITNTYEVSFRADKENAYPAIGEFTQEQGNVTGTFMTESGDYRFLDGLVDGNTLRLSAFDGNHLFVFVANILEDGDLEGIMYSGRTVAEKWVAKVNPDFELRDPEKMTYLKEGYSTIEFSLPQTNDEILEYSPDNYKGKVVILQILGSWCPNCMDESVFLQDLYAKYNSQGLEVIGLAFERRNDKGPSYKAINKMAADLGMTYPVVFAGSTSMADREKALPQLNKVSIFPTSIYLNKKGEVVKIHTGFNGPGTSKYAAFAKETEEMIERLLSE